MEDRRIWKESGTNSDCSSTSAEKSAERTMRHTAEFHFLVAASVPGRKSVAETNCAMSVGEG